jgi:ribosome maturation factor RimP
MHQRREEVRPKMSTADRVRDLVLPLIAEHDLELYDLELAGGVLRILVDRPGGPDVGAITDLTRAVSRALDEHDPIDGHYTLEVSTPGLERPLRTPAHYAGATGTKVKVKTNPGVEGERRAEGVVTAADDAQVTLQLSDGTERTLRYDDIERARTVFEWGPATNERKAKS